MIRFEQSSAENPYGKIVCTIGHDFAAQNKGPFTFRCTNDISKKVVWENKEMFAGWWSLYVEPCNCTAEILDRDGEIIQSWTWETDNHGDLIHRLFMEWCCKNPGAKGIAIGTHDGTTGEWVVPAIEGKIEAYLVEASGKQYLELFQNYRNKANCKPLQSLVTAKGGELEFFESDSGYTNSTSKEHVLKFSQNVRSVKKSSVSINELVELCGLGKDLRWLHLDVEGIDDELILALDPERIRMPEIIIYETLNLDRKRKDAVVRWLEEKNYTCVESGWNTIATINGPELSLLIHTCDEYERFWDGMFYTLDKYWDYDRVKVYFANEIKPLQDISFDSKGIQYRPDRRIRQILTGKSTSKEGFSTRMIYALSKIPTKYVLYMQEDMWLRRALEPELLQEIVDFMEKNDATSVRIHTKLFYYREYILEPTDEVISGQTLYKSVGTSPLSHNATIWNKEYLLRHQRPNEDPWVNEIECSKRMMSENDGNYHYNIHWYCQPGISDMGEFSPEAAVYKHILDEMRYQELSNKNSKG